MTPHAVAWILTLAAGLPLAIAVILIVSARLRGTETSALCTPLTGLAAGLLVGAWMIRLAS